MENTGDIIIYQTDDGLTKIDVKAGDKLDPNIHMAVSYEEK